MLRQAKLSCWSRGWRSAGGGLVARPSGKICLAGGRKAMLACGGAGAVLLRQAKLSCWSRGRRFADVSPWYSCLEFR